MAHNPLAFANYTAEQIFMSNVSEEAKKLRKRCLEPGVSFDQMEIIFKRIFNPYFNYIKSFFIIIDEFSSMRTIWIVGLISFCHPNFSLLTGTNYAIHPKLQCRTFSTA